MPPGPLKWIDVADNRLRSLLRFERHVTEVGFEAGIESVPLARLPRSDAPAVEVSLGVRSITSSVFPIPLVGVLRNGRR